MMRLLNSDGSSDKWRLTGMLYQVALRCIGQDLTPIMLESLEITVEEKDFIAHGRRIGSGAEPFMRRYKPEDIKRLDELGASRKTGIQSTPDASSLPEALRAVGRVVDGKKGRLVKLAKEQNKITFVFQDENGEPHTEQHYSLTTYKSQQEAVSERGTNKPGDVWDDSK
jgi:hypothetical protein